MRLVVGAGQVVYHDPTGGAWVFTGAGNGPFTTPSGLDATLQRGPVTDWTLTDHQSNQAFLFDGAGVLIVAADRNRNPVTFSYDAQAASTNRVTGSAGFNPANSTMVTAGTDGRIHEIDLAPGDGTLPWATKFAYDTNSRLQTVTDMANEVTT